MEVSDRFLQDEKCRVIVLIVHFFSWGEVVWIMRVEALLNDSPKVSRAMIQMRLNAKDPISKITLNKLGRRTMNINARCRDRSSIDRGGRTKAKVPVPFLS